MNRLTRISAPFLLGASMVLPGAQASSLPPMLPVAAQSPYSPEDLPAPTTRNGQEIFEQFRAGLANPQCEDSATSERWKKQFRHATQRLADPSDPLLPLFGYVVDELHKSGLPSEFALIPFVESGYRPDARSKSGPAGLWQFIASTARSHKVPMSGGMDGRLSTSESTAAAVKYLKTLHGIFDGRWELTVMGYNAGEYRILQALRRNGVNAGNASPQTLAGLSPVTYSYVEKLHALSCVLDAAANNNGLMAKLDREVPILTPTVLPAGAASSTLTQRNPSSAGTILALNPLLSSGKASRNVGVLVPASLDSSLMDTTATLGQSAIASTADATPGLTNSHPPASNASSASTARRHTVRSGESLWTIARRHGVAVNALSALNNLETSNVLRPGMVLQLEP